MALQNPCRKVTDMSRLKRSTAALGAALTGLLIASCAVGGGGGGGGGGGTGGAGDGASSDGGGEAAGPELSDEDVTLRMYWWGGDARHGLTQQAIDLFQEKYPNITIEPEFSDWSGYWDKLATSTAGSNAPDVIQMDQLYLASYAERGTLADLDGLEQLDSSTLPDPVLAMGETADGLFGMPISTTGYAILVNVDTLDELGIELPDDENWTWEEYSEWAKSISDASGGAVRGSSVLPHEFGLQQWARQHGENLFADGAVAITPETLAAYFERLKQLVDSGAGQDAGAVSEGINLPLDQNDFVTGKLATLDTPSTMITTYTNATNDAHLELLMMPAIPDAEAGWEYLKPGMYWSVSSQSKHPAEAALLVDFLVNDPEAAAILGVERGLPASATTLEAIRGNLSEPELKAVDFVERLDLGDAPAIVPTGASDIQAVIQRYGLEVIHGQRSASDAAKALIDEVQRNIDTA